MWCWLEEEEVPRPPSTSHLLFLTTLVTRPCVFSTCRSCILLSWHDIAGSTRQGSSKESDALIVFNASCTSWVFSGWCWLSMSHRNDNFPSCNSRQQTVLLLLLAWSHYCVALNYAHYKHSFRRFLGHLLLLCLLFYEDVVTAIRAEASHFVRTFKRSLWEKKEIPSEYSGFYLNVSLPEFRLDLRLPGWR